MEFSDMQATVAEQLNMTITDDTGTITLTSIKRNLNRAYRKIVNRIVSLNQNYYETDAGANLVANQSTYTLPDNFVKMNKLMLGYSSPDILYRACEINRSSIDTSSLSFSTAAPAFTFLDGGFQIFPTPSTDIIMGIRMWYVKDIDDMSADDDEPELPKNYLDVPIEYATAKAKLQLGLVDEASVLLQEFNSEVQSMTYEQVTRSTDSPQFVLVRDKYGDDLD
jgi:hypothetical protein